MVPMFDFVRHLSLAAIRPAPNINYHEPVVTLGGAGVWSDLLEGPVVNVVSGRRDKNMANTGTIKKVVEDRGFGFIAGADGNEYFFHRDGVENFESLRGGESVIFEIQQSDKGPRANQVKVTSN